MARTAEITLDGQSYTIPALNVGQLERVLGAAAGFDVLRIALERATPPLTAEQLNAIEPTMAEVNGAITAIMVLSGMEQPAGPPA